MIIAGIVGPCSIVGPARNWHHERVVAEQLRQVSVEEDMELADDAEAQPA
jgi:hypothetical protein